MNIRPIHNESDYERALAEIERLIDAKEGTKEFERLDLVSILVEKYEREHHHIESPDAVAAIEFCMEQRGLTRKDLERMIGSRGRVAEVLNRKRPLSISMVRSLHAELGIPAEILIRETTKKPLRRGSTRASSRIGSTSSSKRRA